MKGIGVVLVLLGIACFVLPLLDAPVPFLYALGNVRPLLAGVLVLIGGGLFFFSTYE